MDVSQFQLCSQITENLAIEVQSSLSTAMRQIAKVEETSGRKMVNTRDSLDAFAKLVHHLSFPSSSHNTAELMVCGRKGLLDTMMEIRDRETYTSFKANDIRHAIDVCTMLIEHMEEDAFLDSIAEE
jgi:hypothetical protein